MAASMLSAFTAQALAKNWTVEKEKVVAKSEVGVFKVGEAEVKCKPATYTYKGKTGRVESLVFRVKFEGCSATLGGVGAEKTEVSELQAELKRPTSKKEKGQGEGAVRAHD